MLLQNVFNLLKYKEIEQKNTTMNTDTNPDFENSSPNGFFCFLENKLTYLNTFILFFFHPLTYFKNNNSVDILENTPFFKKMQLGLILLFFSYLVYYFFGWFNVKNNYCSSSFWLWIVMFLVIYLFYQ